VAVRTVPATRARVAAVPAWAWLTGIVVLAFAVFYLLGRRMVAPWILIDELIYSSLARSFAATGEFLIRGEHYRHIGPVYPAVISPAYAIFDSVPQAYAAVKVINAALISLTAVPAYFLGRRVLTARFALVGALLAVAVPSMLYAGTVMTENAFYPVFVATALAFVLALERPTVARTLVLLALCALAFFIRAQAIVLLPAIATAPLLIAAFRRNLRVLREYWPLFALVVVVIVPPVLVELARGRPVSGLFGRYSFVGHLNYSVWPVLRWFFYHLAELDLYVAVIPFAALLLLLLTARRLTPAGQAFVAATAALTFWIALEVGAFIAAQPWLNRIQDRNTFFVAPLLVIALLVWVERGLPRPRAPVAVAAVVAAALPAVLPLGTVLRSAVVSDGLGLIPWWRLEVSGSSVGVVRMTMILGCIVAGLLFLLLPRRFGAVLPGLILLCFVGVGVAAERQFRGFSVASLHSAVSGPPYDWIDRDVPQGASVAIVWSGKPNPVPIWEDEFFNRRTGPVYSIDGRMPGDLPETTATLGARGELLVAGKPVTAPYVLSDRAARVVGHALESQIHGAFTLWRASGPLRLRR
jgi:hypothetical protein